MSKGNITLQALSIMGDLLDGCNAREILNF